jgi:hypothetical protein
MRRDWWLVMPQMVIQNWKKNSTLLHREGVRQVEYASNFLAHEEP